MKGAQWHEGGKKKTQEAGHIFDKAKVPHLFSLSLFSPDHVTSVKYLMKELTRG
ncbi:hypothetical protein Bpfe_012038, partial [Biomphalaria pfeifferi]